MKRIALLIVLPALLFVSAKAQTLPTIDIVYSESSVTVSVPDEIASYVTTSASGAHLYLANNMQSTECRYRLSGSSTNGSFTLTAYYKLELELAGLTLTSQSGAAIDIDCGKRIAVVLDEGTVNTLSDASGGTHKAAFYFAGHPEFQGGGTLNVTGNTKHAISAKEYLELKKSTGTINVLGAVSDGIHCGKGKVNNTKNYFEMKGGVVNISGVGSDCIDSDDYGCMRIESGQLNLDVTAASGAGLKCDSVLTMNGGDINISLSGADAEGIRCNYAAYFNGGDITVSNSGAGAKAIKLKNDTTGTALTVVNGGYAYFQGTDVDITLSGDNHTDGSRCMGVSVDRDMTVSDAQLAFLPLASAPKAYNVKGTLSITEQGSMLLRGRHDLFSVHDFQYDHTAYVRLMRESVLVTDYANYQISALNASQAVCGVADVYLLPGEVAYGYLRIYSNTPGETLSFQAYDASEGQAYAANEVLTFAANAYTGQPSAPYTLSIGAPDTTPTISNLCKLIGRLLGGNTSESYNDITKMADAILLK